MATTKRPTPNSSSSKMFPIIISVVVIVMVAIVVLSVTSNKKEVASQSKIEYSDTVNVSAASVKGKIGESKLAPYDSSTSDTEVGKIVPQISAQDFTGKVQTVVPGTRPYVLAFVAHWCPHCRKEVPKLVKMKKDGQLPSDVEFIAIATGTSESKPNYPPSTWLLDEEWPWKKLVDDRSGTIASNFGLDGYPYLVFVKADGTISQRMSGEQEDSVYISAAEAISEKK
ncbi:MAG: TlpA disulfide reductase family protein [Acidimicrobiia bacterium]